MSQRTHPTNSQHVASLRLPESGVVRILSDLHLGHPGTLFSSISEVLPLLEGADLVIFNGDVTEDCSKDLEPKSTAMWNELLEELDARNIRWHRLRGNHDPLTDLPGAFTLDGEKLLITHGDACFEYGSPWSRWLPEIKHRLDAIREDFIRDGLNPLNDRLALAEAWASCFHPPTRHNQSKRRGIFAYIWQAFWPPSVAWRLITHRLRTLPKTSEFLETYAPNTRLLIYGHMHRAGVWKRNGRVLINTGAFQSFAGQLVCELDHTGITVRKVRRKDGRFDFGRKKCHFSWSSLGVDPYADQSEQ